MVTAFRVPTFSAVVVCVLIAQSSSILFASEPAQPPAPNAHESAALEQHLTTVNSTPALNQQTPLRLSFDPARLPALSPTVSNALEGQFYRGRYRHRHDGSLTAIVVGAAATIAGAAVLTYANRPECSANQFADGCGYGTKVVGTSVILGGLVSLFAGAVTW